MSDLLSCGTDSGSDQAAHAWAGLSPSPWVRACLAQRRLPEHGACVLDHAAGSGRNLVSLLPLDAVLVASDRDVTALRALNDRPWPSRRARLEVIETDLESGRWPYGVRRFDRVICINYLFRPRLDLLAAAVAPGGTLIYETFGVGHERFGRPRNPDFLVRPGELLALCDRAGLSVIAYEFGERGDPASAVVGRVHAERPRVG